MYHKAGEAGLEYSQTQADDDRRRAAGGAQVRCLSKRGERLGKARGD